MAPSRRRGRHSWKQILVRTYQEILEDRVLAVAAGCVFYVLLAIFPAIATFVSVYALFADAATIRDHLVFAAGVLPADAFNLLQGEVIRIASKGSASLGIASVLGLVFALWSTNAGTKAIFDALNVAFDKTEKRSFIQLNLISLGFTLAAIVVLLLAISGVVVLSLVLGSLHMEDFGAVMVSIARWPVLFFVIAAGLSVISHFGPSGRTSRWRLVTVGSLAASLLWLVGSGLFSWYLSNFADYSATYGGLGAAIGLMMWLWLSFVVILSGAKLDAEIQDAASANAASTSKPRT